MNSVKSSTSLQLKTPIKIDICTNNIEIKKYKRK